MSVARSARTAREQRSNESILDVADTCETTEEPDRRLDARIALAVFPALRHLSELDVGVWRHTDGHRVRALRYSFTATTAAMLVPLGHWIEPDPDNPQRIWVCGPDGGTVSASNRLSALAISAAALRAQHKSRSAENG